MKTTPAQLRHLLEQANRDLTAAQAILGPTLELIHNSLNGHPRAARYDRSTGRTALWCFTHQRDHQLCERDALPCGGTPVTAVDPTGDAATQPDPAAKAERKIDRRITALALQAAVLAAELHQWQPTSTDMQHPDPTSAVAPDGWCTSCWRNDHQHEPITRRHDGTPYYAGLCQWCGEFRANHAGQLPALAILRHRHQGGRITQTLIDRLTHRRAS